jgi:hypothetical protein
VLRVRVVVRLAFDFEHQINAVAQPDDEIRFVECGWPYRSQGMLNSSRSLRA